MPTSANRVACTPSSVTKKCLYGKFPLRHPVRHFTSLTHRTLSLATPARGPPKPSTRILRLRRMDLDVSAFRDLYTMGFAPGCVDSMAWSDVVS
jgi:hypothetical protein